MPTTQINLSSGSYTDAGVTDNTAEIVDAFASGLPVDGGNLIYGVAGNLTSPPDRLKNIRLMQLDPDNAGRRTLYKVSQVNDLDWDNVVVNRNGTPTQGSMSVPAAGIMFVGLHGRVRNCEVYGDGKGAALMAVNCDIAFESPNVHDIRWQADSDPMTEQIVAMWLISCSGYVNNPKITNILGKINDNVGHAGFTPPPDIFFAYQTDGLDCGGCENMTIVGGRMTNVGEGVDCSGSLTNRNVRIIGMGFIRCGGSGLKFTNAYMQCAAIGCYATDCGYAGAAFGGGATESPRDFLLSGFVSRNSGSNGWWSIPRCGVRYFETTHPPINFKWDDCIAVDDQATPTMQYGFYNEDGNTGIALGNYSVFGATVADLHGFSPASIDVILADRTYYVSPTGSDGNNGLSAATAFLTVQAAVDAVAVLDIGNHNVTIQLADGTYSGPVTVNGPWTGSGDVTIQGNAGTPANVILSTGALTSVNCKNGGRIAIKNLKIATTTGPYCLYAFMGGAIDYANIVFGACAQAHILAEDGGRITCSGSYSITAGAPQHWRISGGSIRCQSHGITLTGTPAFPQGFAFGRNVGFMIVNGNVFTGAATGPRYDVALNATIQTAGGGANYLPGNAAGIAATGWQYA